MNEAHSSFRWIHSAKFPVGVGSALRRDGFSESRRKAAPTVSSCAADCAPVIGAFAAKQRAATHKPAGFFFERTHFGFFRPASADSIRCCPADAFTLIELLVVVGLIVVLIAGAGIAFGGRGSEGVALANAQSTLFGLVGAARAQAALHQTTARLLVYAAPPPLADAGKYLRCLQVVREDPFGSGAWVAAGDAVMLPPPICLVPPNVPPSHLAVGVVWSGTLTSGPLSSLAGPVPIEVVGQSHLVDGRQVGFSQPFVGARGGSAYYLEFFPDGTTTGIGSTVKLALSPAILAAEALPQFDQPEAVRGVVIRKSGAVSLVTGASNF